MTMFLRFTQEEDGDGYTAISIQSLKVICLDLPETKHVIEKEYTVKWSPQREQVVKYEEILIPISQLKEGWIYEEKLSEITNDPRIS